MFEKAKSKSLLSSLSLLANPERAQRYFWCIALGMPIYFTTGILFTFSPELTAALGVVGKVEAGNALLFGSIGLTIGDMLSGLIGQLLRSRKKSVFISLTLGFICSLIYLNISGLTSDIIYALCFIMGISAGYWAVLVTIAAEQFGTNIRGTVATTVPNFVRGSAIICTLLFLNLKQTNSAGTAAFIVGGICYAFAFVALYKLRETYGYNLDYTEN
jgi:MFS family permease